MEQNYNNNLCEILNRVHTMKVDGDNDPSKAPKMTKKTKKKTHLNMCIFRLNTILEIYGRKELLVVNNLKMSSHKTIV